MNVALPLERMSSKERMTPREKNVVVQPSKKSLRRRMRRWTGKRVLADARGRLRLPLFFSGQPLIRAVGPGSRHLTGKEEESPVASILRWVTMAHCSSPSSQMTAAEFLPQEILDHEAPAIKANFRPLPSRITPMGGGIYEGKTNTASPSMGQ